jgi:hypothetical protein
MLVVNLHIFIFIKPDCRIPLRLFSPLRRQAGLIHKSMIELSRISNGKVISKKYPASNDFMLSAETKKVTKKRTYNPEAMVPQSKRQKMPSKTDKNSILTAYGESFHIKGFDSQETSTTVKGELQSTPKYPPHHCLVIDCKMKPSLDHALSPSTTLSCSSLKITRSIFWRLKIYIAYPRSIECMATWSPTSYV